MPQMSRLRRFLGGYKLIRVDKFRDISYMSEWEIKQGWGVPQSFLYYQNKHGKIVKKTIDGYWELEEAKEKYSHE